MEGGRVWKVGRERERRHEGRVQELKEEERVTETETERQRQRETIKGAEKRR